MSFSSDGVTQQVHMIPGVSSSFKIGQKLPKTFPKPFPKSTPNRSKWLLGAYLGPMVLQKLYFEHPKTGQEVPRAPKRRPRPSQTLPKWSPRPSQIRFLSNFWASLFLVANLHVFCSFVAEFVCFCKSRPLKFMRPRSVLLTSTRFGMFRKKYQKSSKNLLETCPKSRKNQRKIEKNENKSMEKAKMSEENQKMSYKFEKMRKKCQLEPI